MASSEFKKYAQKKQWINFPHEMTSLLQEKNEKHLVKFLQEGFDVPDDIKKNQARICFGADLVNRTASLGWHESLKILLTNECYIDHDAEVKNDRWDTLMWVLVCSADHPKTVRTVVDHMINQVYLVDEYIAYEICSNHPQIWPGVSDLFPKTVQEQAFGWALTGRRDHPEGNYEVILLSQLEQELSQISRKDTILKTKCYQQHIEGEYSKFKSCNVFDIARWAVMGNLSEVFDMAEHIISKDSPKHQGWVIDLSPGSKGAQSVVKWQQWKQCKVQFSYLYNTLVSQKIFTDMIDPKVVVSNSSLYVNEGVLLWQKTHDWNIIERLRRKAPKIACDVLYKLPINEIVQHPEGVFQHPYICDILHGRGVGLTKNTSFFAEIFKKCSAQYQADFVLRKPINEDSPPSSSDVFLQHLKDRQRNVSPPKGFFDSVISGFANPYSKKKI